MEKLHLEIVPPEYDSEKYTNAYTICFYIAEYSKKIIECLDQPLQVEIQNISKKFIKRFVSKFDDFCNTRPKISHSKRQLS